MKQRELDEAVERVWRRCSNWGELERAAGVTDRVAWWKGRNEESARAALRELIRQRIVAGVLA